MPPHSGSTVHRPNDDHSYAASEVTLGHGSSRTRAVVWDIGGRAVGRSVRLSLRTYRLWHTVRKGAT